MERHKLIKLYPLHWYWRARN